MDVGFHFNFDLGLEKRGLVSGSLSFVIWGRGTLFYNFLGGLGEILLNFLFFTSFLNFFFQLFKKNFYFFFIYFFYCFLLVLY